LDAEKVNAAFDVMGALNGVQYHARFWGIQQEEK
jgi:hypothetical protein